MNDRERDDRERPERRGDSHGSHGRNGRPSDRKPRREGERREGDRPRYDGDRRPRREDERREGDRPRYDRDRKPRYDGDRSRREGERPRRDGERPRYDDRPRRDGDRPRRDGERPRYDGDRSRYDGDRGPRRDGDRPRYDGDRRPRRDGERREGERRGGERSGYDRDRKPRYDGDRPRRDGDRPQRGASGSDRDRLGRGGTRGGGRSDRGGRDREFTEAERLQHELRPVRSDHDDPAIPDEVTEKDLHPGARNELKTLQPETAERVARHLAMVAGLIATDPGLAHQHAISATRRAGRIPVARETLAITAYHVGDYALALRELRTFRRLTGSQGHLALMVECERALGRPERGIETGLAAELGGLSTEQRVQLAIAMSGARLDLGQTQQALFELEIPELNPNKAFDWSPELFAAYANVLEDLGRDAESAKWRERALMAEAAINEHLGGHDQLEVLEVYEHSADRIDPTEPSEAAESPEEGAPADPDEAPEEQA